MPFMPVHARQDLYAYRTAPLNFAKSLDEYGVARKRISSGFYSESEAKRARRVHLEGVVNVFPGLPPSMLFNIGSIRHAQSFAVADDAWLN